MPGLAIFAWSRRIWAAPFMLGLFGFLHVLVNPQSGYLADTARTPLFTGIGMFVVFGVGALASGRTSGPAASGGTSVDGIEFQPVRRRFDRPHAR